MFQEQKRVIFRLPEKVDRLPSNATLLDLPTSDDVCLYGTLPSVDRVGSGQEIALLHSNVAEFVRRKLSEKNIDVPASSFVYQWLQRHFPVRLANGKIADFPDQDWQVSQIVTECSRKGGEKRVLGGVEYWPTQASLIEEVVMVLFDALAHLPVSSDFQLSREKVVVAVRKLFSTIRKISEKPLPPETPDAVLCMLQYLESLENNRNFVELRKSILDVLEGVAIPEMYKLPLLEYLEEVGEFDHPLAIQLYLHIRQQDPEDLGEKCRIIERQEELRRVLLEQLAGSPQELFEVFGNLYHRASLLFCGYGQSDELEGRVGAEWEFLPRQEEKVCPYAGRFQVGTDPRNGLGEMRVGGDDGDRVSQHFTKEYLGDLYLLARYFFDMNCSIDSLHLHFDLVEHPYPLALGNMLLHANNGRGIVEHQDRLDGDTVEVRQLLPPFYGTNTFHAGRLGEVMAFYAGISREEQHISFNKIVSEEGEMPSREQLMWGHILRQTSDPRLRLLALRTLRDPFIFSSADYAKIVENYESSNMASIARSMFSTLIEYSKALPASMERPMFVESLSFGITTALQLLPSAAKESEELSSILQDMQRAFFHEDIGSHAKSIIAEIFFTIGYGWGREKMRVYWRKIVEEFFTDHTLTDPLVLRYIVKILPGFAEKGDIEKCIDQLTKISLISRDKEVLSTIFTQMRSILARDKKSLVSFCINMLEHSVNKLEDMPNIRQQVIHLLSDCCSEGVFMRELDSEIATTVMMYALSYHASSSDTFTDRVRLDTLLERNSPKLIKKAVKLLLTREKYPIVVNLGDVLSAIYTSNDEDGKDIARRLQQHAGKSAKILELMKFFYTVAVGYEELSAQLVHDHFHRSELEIVYGLVMSYEKNTSTIHPTVSYMFENHTQVNEKEFGRFVDGYMGHMMKNVASYTQRLPMILKYYIEKKSFPIMLIEHADDFPNTEGVLRRFVDLLMEIYQNRKDSEGGLEASYVKQFALALLNHGDTHTSIVRRVFEHFASSRELIVKEWVRWGIYGGEEPFLGHIAWALSTGHVSQSQVDVYRKNVVV